MLTLKGQVSVLKTSWVTNFHKKCTQMDYISPCVKVPKNAPVTHITNPVTTPIHNAFMRRRRPSNLTFADCFAPAPKKFEKGLLQA